MNKREMCVDLGFQFGVQYQIVQWEHLYAA